MRWVLGLLVLLAVLAPGGSAGAAQSTTYQLDAAHTGATTEPGRDPPFARRWAVMGKLRSRVRTLWTDFPARVRVRGAGTRRPRLVYTVYAFRGAKLRRKRV